MTRVRGRARESFQLVSGLRVAVPVGCVGRANYVDIVVSE